MVELTQKQKIYKELFENLREQEEATRETILYHMVAHEQEGHVIIPMDEEELEHPDPSTGAMCVICRKHLGWYCPKSPDHLCHYSTGECCDYCKMPSERK